MSASASRAASTTCCCPESKGCNQEGVNKGGAEVAAVSAQDAWLRFLSRNGLPYVPMAKSPGSAPAKSRNLHASPPNFLASCTVAHAAGPL